MKLSECVKNKIKLNEFGIWELEPRNAFAYSDGSAVEDYLYQSVKNASDLHCRSVELEKFIIDWPSEYHFSHKRSQLLSGFNYQKNLNVLEVGCGCGAITRFLGEALGQVVAVEGSLARAKIARQRTRDLHNVQFLVAPFDQVEFNMKFDLIFCIGVLEYSPSFIAGKEPFKQAISYFSSLLSEKGSLVLAIENQFGLKYFWGASEDHCGRPYEGLEGYPVKGAQVRTFGVRELHDLLVLNFESVDEYFPFPDYKLPDCILSKSFLDSGLAGELVSQNIRSKAAHLSEITSWNPELTALELSKNGMLNFFSNSFLVIAHKSSNRFVSFPQEGIMYSMGRLPSFRMVTKIQKEGDSFVARKSKVDCFAKSEQSSPIHVRESESLWINSVSIETCLIQNCRKLVLEDLFMPAKIWLEHLKTFSFCKDGVLYVDGGFIDCIWKNSYIKENQCYFIDSEWTWHDSLPINVVAIRSIYFFIKRIESLGLKSPLFEEECGRKLIKDIAHEIGLSIADEDFEEFVENEARLINTVFGSSQKKAVFLTEIWLNNRAVLKLYGKLKSAVGRLIALSRIIITKILAKIK